MVARATLRAGLIVPTLLAGCAAVQAPVPEPVPALHSARQSVEAAAAAAVSAAAARCGKPGDADCFYGSIGEMLDVVAARRLDYAQRARASINDTALYNALLYPAGATVLYRRLRGLPHSGLLFPASVAAGLYGLMTSGVPEIHKHYLRGAREMMCLEVRYALWSYRNRDVVGLKRPDTDQSLDRSLDQSLDQIIQTLRDKAGKYAETRAEVLLVLQPPRTPAGPADAFERARGVGGGSAKKDRREDLERHTGEQLTIAWNALDALVAIRGEIDAAAGRLEREFVDLERDVQAGIADRAPAPQDPQVVAATLKQQIAKAQSGLPGAARLDPLIPLALREGVRDPDTKLSTLAKKGQALQLAWVNARQFQLAHLQRAAMVAADVEGLGCRERSAPVPAAPAPVPPPAPAPAPAGSPAISPLPQG